jgi:type I restriction enzyme R subunit
VVYFNAIKTDQQVQAVAYITRKSVQRSGSSSVNPGDKFELVFKNLLETLFVERMDQNEEIFARFMNDRSFQKVVTGWLSTEAYRKLNSPGEDVNVGK